MSANRNAESRKDAPVMEITVHPATAGMFPESDGDNDPPTPELPDVALSVRDNAPRS
jgi:hypothetical protein